MGLTLVLVAGACAGKTRRVAAPGPAPTVATTTSTAAPATTVTTAAVPAPPLPTFPLTGLPVTNAANANRPALSVKVDNTSPARPQSGLNNADIVVDTPVEGGLTRLFATFQSTDAAPVGPIRSARPVDADLLSELGGGILAYSGAATGEIAPSKAHSGAVLISDDGGNRGFYRSNARGAPYNLYGTTPAFYQEGLRVHGGPLPPPPHLLTYSPAPPAGSPVSNVSMVFSSYASAGWTWNAATRLYSRLQDGGPDHLADGSVITANDVVIMSVTLAHTGIFDQAHNEDPLVVVIGSGTCWVMRDGELIQGTWHRTSYAQPMQLIGPGGQVIALQPGRTWIELLPRTAPGQPRFS